MSIKVDSQIFNQQLSQADNPLKSCYFFVGKNQFLLEESASLLVDRAKKNGLTQRDIFYINNKTKFQPIEHSLSSPGLFDPVAIIDLRLETDKPTQKIGEQLAKIAQHGTQNLMLIQAPNLNYSVQKTAWYKAIQSHAETVIAQPVSNQQLANWIFQKSQQFNLTLTSEAIAKIKESSEGNLLWANQILLQLINRHEEESIGLDIVNQLLSDMSVFQLDDLMTAIFNKDHKAIKIAEKLEHENHPLTKITFVLAKDLSTLHQLLESRSPFSQACNHLGIWKSKQANFQSATQHFTLESIDHALHQMAQLDKVNKGQSQGNAWLMLHKSISDLIFNPK